MFYHHACTSDHEGYGSLAEGASLGSYTFQTACGIDSLYYYVSSTHNYAPWYADLAEVIGAKKDQHGGFIPKGSLHISLFDHQFLFYGSEKGFYYFGDCAGWFRIGFKDPTTNTNVRDIKIQLQAQGIYSVGIPALLDHISIMIGSIAYSDGAVSRADLNIFCQYDLGAVITSTMFVTKKTHYERIIGTTKKETTHYLGKPPFRLRWYDKSLELRKSSKLSLMKDYYQSKGLSLDQPLWNFEFECHRDFLKGFGIRSVEDLLAHANNLFHYAMRVIRLHDLDALPLHKRDPKNLRKAPIHPLWTYLDHAYRYEAVPQSLDMLIRLYPPKQPYTQQAFLDEIRLVMEKAKDHHLILHKEDLRQVFHDYELLLSPRAKKALSFSPPVQVEANGQNFLMTKNRVCVVTLPTSLRYKTDQELHKLSQSLTQALHKELAQQDPDTSLIIKNIAAITEESYQRSQEKKNVDLFGEADLWQV